MGATDNRSTRRRRADKAALKASWAAAARPCFLCGQPIDYSLPWDDKNAVTEEHIKPWSTHPHLRDDSANKAPAHASCNKSRGARPQSPSLGMTSRDW